MRNAIRPAIKDKPPNVPPTALPMMTSWFGFVGGGFVGMAPLDGEGLIVVEDVFEVEVEVTRLDVLVVSTPMVVMADGVPDITMNKFPISFSSPIPSPFLTMHAYMRNLFLPKEPQHIIGAP